MSNGLNADLEKETKIKIVTEALEIMGLTYLASMLKKSGGENLRGYIEIAKHQADKKGEIFIAEKMRAI